MVAKIDLVGLGVRYRTAISRVNNPMDPRVRQAIYRSADTFIFLAFEPLYPCIIRDSPQADIIFPKKVGVLYTTD
jgi:hypothetical protein